MLHPDPSRPYVIVLKVVSRSEKGPLSESGFHFAKLATFLISCPHLLIKTIHNSLSFIPKSIGLKTEMQVDPPRITEILSPTGSFPLGSALATNMVAPRTAILGDAAHRVHPFAGQGANMGWRDVELLTDELERAHLSGIDYTRLKNTLVPV